MDDHSPLRVASSRRQSAGVGGEARSQMALPGIGEADANAGHISQPDGDSVCRMPCGESVLCWCRFMRGGIRRTVVYKPAGLREDYHIGSDMVSRGREKMFIKPLAGRAVELNQKAESIGIEVGEIEGNKEFPRFRVAVRGNTFALKDALKAAGFRFDGVNKVWFVGGYDDMESFLSSI